MPFLDDLEQLVARERGQQAADERDAKAEQRIQSLEATVAALPDAIVAKLQPAAPPTDSSGDPPPPDPGPDPVPDPAPNPELPVERVTKANVPRIWSGDDEPAKVSYIDADTGETKTRKGRRKGQPAVYDVETVDDLAPPEEPAA